MTTEDERRERVRDDSIHNVGFVRVKQRGAPIVPDITEKIGGAASSPPEAVTRRATGDESLEDAAARQRRLDDLIAKMRNK